MSAADIQGMSWNINLVFTSSTATSSTRNEKTSHDEYSITTSNSRIIENGNIDIYIGSTQALRGILIAGWGMRGVAGSFQPSHLLLIGVHGLLQRDAELLAYRLELLEVLCVLALVLDLELDTCCVLVIMML
jgi:hypothetical protein